MIVASHLQNVAFGADHKIFNLCMHVITLLNFCKTVCQWNVGQDHFLLKMTNYLTTTTWPLDNTPQSACIYMYIGSFETTQNHTEVHSGLYYHVLAKELSTGLLHRHRQQTYRYTLVSVHATNQVPYAILYNSSTNLKICLLIFKIPHVVRM